MRHPQVGLPSSGSQGKQTRAESESEVGREREKGTAALLGGLWRSSTGTEKFADPCQARGTRMGRAFGESNMYEFGQIDMEKYDLS